MKYILYLLLLFPIIADAQVSYELSTVNAEANTSLRGVSVVNDSIAWVSGSNGMVGKTTDGGRTWKWARIKGYESLDFRDIEAFDDQQAVVLNAGSPAYILRTTDGGKNWKTSYQNTDSLIFLNGMDFWDKQNGIAFGDPINHKLQLLVTADGGMNWKDISSRLPESAPGEAGFAASGSSIRTVAGGKVWIVTGGIRSNVYVSADYGETWKKYDCPLVHGKSSTGAFAVDFYDQSHGVVVGGDYQQERDNSNNVLLTDDGGKSWRKPSRPVFGYRSGVTWYDFLNCFATGTSGTDVSRDGGKTWYHISDESFNTVKRAKDGRLVILAGNKGLIYTLKLK